MAICRECKEAVNTEDSQSASACPKCGRSGAFYDEHSAVEVGHAFYLGDKYSCVFDARLPRPDIDAVYLEMGCFGIGVSRILGLFLNTNLAACAATQRNSLLWPPELAPYKVCIIALKPDPTSNDPLHQAKNLAVRLQQRCPSLHGEVILDDRKVYSEVSPGRMLKEAHVIGYPARIILGNLWAERGAIEVELANGSRHFFETVDSVAEYLESSFPRDMSRQSPGMRRSSYETFFCVNKYRRKSQGTGNRDLVRKIRAQLWRHFLVRLCRRKV